MAITSKGNIQGSDFSDASIDLQALRNSTAGGPASAEERKMLQNLLKDKKAKPGRGSRKAIKVARERMKRG